MKIIVKIHLFIQIVKGMKAEYLPTFNTEKYVASGRVEFVNFHSHFYSNIHIPTVNIHIPTLIDIHAYSYSSCINILTYFSHRLVSFVLQRQIYMAVRGGGWGTREKMGQK